MERLLLVLPVLLPVVFWALYHYHKDRHLPEPPANLLLCFGLGLLAAALSKSMYLGLEPLGLRFDAAALAGENRPGLLAYALLAIGPIEELAKMLPFLVVVLRLKAFDEPLDGIVYASFIGLGYAAIENFDYLDYLTPLESIARGFAGPVIHILFASIWANWISSAWLRKEPILIPALKGGILASLTHGMYDFLVMLRPVSALPIAAAMIIVIWVWRLRLMHRMHRDAIADAREVGEPD